MNGCDRKGHLIWSSPPLFMVSYYCLSKGLEKQWNKPQKWVETKLLKHVPRCQVSACISHVPVPFPPGTKSTWGLVELRGTFSQYSALSGTLFLQERSTTDSKATPSLADTPSAWAYSFSPLKVIRVSDMGQSNDLVSLLFWEIIVDVMDNSTYKLAAFGATSSLDQKVCKIFSSPNVRQQGLTNCNRFMDCMVANWIALFL